MTESFYPKHATAPIPGVDVLIQHKADEFNCGVECVDLGVSVNCVPHHGSGYWCCGECWESAMTLSWERRDKLEISRAALQQAVEALEDAELSLMDGSRHVMGERRTEPCGSCLASVRECRAAISTGRKVLNG